MFHGSVLPMGVAVKQVLPLRKATGVPGPQEHPILPFLLRFLPINPRLVEDPAGRTDRKSVGGDRKSVGCPAPLRSVRSDTRRREEDSKDRSTTAVGRHSTLALVVALALSSPGACEGGGGDDDDGSGYGDYALNAVFFENYWNDGSSQDQERYLDNFVISTEPIGCL